jgi:hypothetical protein
MTGEELPHELIVIDQSDEPDPRLARMAAL